ncbi:hypothetical protein [Dietzia alimentaria]|uniref:hypothetical protein n=1 Tax=Dietzia alimentaria TaxID=665550 RepID=UPI0004967051|nr:hypothetical protein [Dietzia alimentaria]
MDSAHSVDVVMAVPYTVNLGQTIDEHVLHSMSGEVAQVVDGAIVHLPTTSCRYRRAASRPVI